MTKELYIKYRNEGSSEFIYEYYKENFNISRHTFLLDIAEFFKCFGVWPENMATYQTITAFYDAKFNIVRIEDKNRNIIGYL